ncbi:SDR family oxidoreductase [Streptomyces achromogenes]|uniref:SDR family oxidoreductase n=1 Tax=Streptomyces achromogenes TaxID=67255 RepID=UPI000691880F|nr:SDR family oxidoreductase [Streptomyces achromogenes]
MTTPDNAENLVAVVGIGLAVPGANSPAELWRLLNGSHDAFSEPRDRFRLDHFWSDDPQEEDKTYARRAGFLHGFRPHPKLREEERSGAGRDDASRWLRHALLQAREHVRTGPGRRCAAYIGGWPGGSQSLVESVLVDVVTRPLADRQEAEQVRKALFEHYRHALPASEAATPDAVVREVFSRLPESLTESCVVDTACASSLYAVDLGVKALLAGECEIAYCGGVTVVDPTMAVMFAKLNGLSRHGRVRAFTKAADGTLFSDGAGVVALKTLRQATRDGDTVHGVLLGFGGAADGRGKSISAPNPAGQRRAIERARSVNSVTSEQVDWVVAHGTGTAAGDRVESQVLSALGPSSGQLCTSNKPVFGHTGWTAGVVSLIHALLGLRHGWVPAQLGAREDPQESSGGLRVPLGPVRLRPRRDGRRTVGVSAFGFGGTNAHLLVADRCERPGLRSAPQGSADEGMVLVAWSAHLPGAPSRSALRDWLRGSAPAPEASFPDPYPAPQPAEVRLSARTLPVVDPGQLMGLQAAARFVDDHGEIWAELRETTGVIAAHTGMPRGLVGTAVRCYAHDAGAVLRARASEPGFTRAAARLETARQSFPACTEDSQAGVLPNVIASRIAARYDLHGPTMAVDSGVDSTLTALRVAQRYLRSGELDLALVLAVNGNATATNAAVTRTGATALAEGAFLLAVTTERLAEQHGWRALARMSFADQEAEAETADVPEAPARGYLAADQAVALLRAAESEDTAVRLRARHHDATLFVAPVHAGRPASPALSAPSSPRTTTRYARHLVREPLPVPHGRTSPAHLPPRGIVLTESAEVAAEVRAEAEATGSTVLVLPSGAGTRVPVRDQEALLAAADRSAPHLTVVGDLATLPLDRALALHEMAFLAVQRLWVRPRPDSSLIVLLSGATDPGPGAGVAALFEGMVKSLRWERPDAVAVTVASDETEVAALLARAAAERTARPGPPPVVRYLDGERRIETLLPAPLPAATPAFNLLPDDCVGVITGGSSGIARALLTALPQRLRPRLWLLGRTPVGDSQHTGEAGNGAGRRTRPALVRQVRRDHPDLPMRAVVARVDGMLRQRQVNETLEALRARFGDDRVHYATCDVTDEGSVHEVIGEVLRTEGRVDFVLHAAGQVASTLLRNKSLEAFRAVRDTKVLGHRHLAGALASSPPRWWCNIGSYSGTAGAPGDTDYASANAYLAAVAETATGAAQTTIGFTMWRQTGMGADELFQEHVARQGRFTPISTEEGAEQFAAEMRAAPLAGGSSVYLGPAERDRLRRHLPGFVRDEPPRPLAVRRRPSWWTRLPETPHGAEWTHLVDPHVERHLFDHLVSGKPTIPATFILDLAAQAAEALVPDAVTTGFREACFDTFIRPFNRKVPSPLRIRARMASPQPPEPDALRSAVQVSIHSDTLDPRGGMRPGALRHFQAVVLLDRHARRQAPRRDTRPLRSPMPAQDPYASLHAPVSLRGPFRNLSDCLVDSTAARGTWTPSLAGHPWLRTMTTPALFLCAALRTLALRPDPAGHQPLFVPRSIGRIELYTDGANDHDLLLRYGHCLGVSADDTGVCSGTTPDGRLLALLSEVELVDVADQPRTANTNPHASTRHRFGTPRRSAGHAFRPLGSNGTGS